MQKDLSTIVHRSKISRLSLNSSKSVSLLSLINYLDEVIIYSDQELWNIILGIRKELVEHSYQRLNVLARPTEAKSPASEYRTIDQSRRTTTRLNLFLSFR